MRREDGGCDFQWRICSFGPIGWVILGCWSTVALLVAVGALIGFFAGGSISSLLFSIGAAAVGVGIMAVPLMLRDRWKSFEVTMLSHWIEKITTDLS